MKREIRQLVQQIHDSRGRVMVITAGAGTQAVAWLLGMAGASRTLLEALVPYDESSFNDLYQIAWCAIESALYKFNNEPGHPKIFNMWSQIAHTAILAAIKKDNRDKKNSEGYRYFLDERAIKKSAKFERFMNEAKDVCKYVDDFMNIIGALENLYYTDQKPHEGLIGKLTKESGMSRAKNSSNPT